MKNSILRAGPADQKRGTGVVCRMIGRNLTGRKIGVAVSAAARAGVVDADVHTGRAAAFRPLPFGGRPVQRLPQQRFKQRSVHAASMGNACRTQIQCLGAALHTHAAAGGNFGNSAGKAGGRNAALYAVSMLALGDAELAAKLKKFREDQAKIVLSADAELQEELKER